MFSFSTVFCPGRIFFFWYPKNSAARLRALINSFKDWIVPKKLRVSLQVSHVSTTTKFNTWENYHTYIALGFCCCTNERTPEYCPCMEAAPSYDWAIRFDYDIHHILLGIKNNDCKPRYTDRQKDRLVSTYT